MEDPYLRERKADLEQVIERVISRLHVQQSQLESDLQAAVRQSGDAQKNLSDDLEQMRHWC